MAQITTHRLVDDLDGGEAAETVSFGLGGKNYEIDLSEKRATELRDILAELVGAARRVGGSTVARTRRGASAQPSAAREDTAAIRRWAGDNGFKISSRGRIPTNVREAYENREATNTPALAVEVPVAEAKPKRRSRKKVADPFTPAS